MLQNLDLEKIVNEWSERSRLLYEVLATIIGTSNPSGKQAPPMAVAGSILLHQRNKQMSAVQNSLGLQMDFGGTRDKALSILAGCGISASTTTLYRRKKDIERHHNELVNESIVRRRDQIISREIARFPSLSLPVFTANSSNVRFIHWLLESQVLPCNRKPEKEGLTESRSWAIYGDNLDHTVHSFHATKGNRGKTFTGLC